MKRGDPSGSARKSPKKNPGSSSVKQQLVQRRSNAPKLGSIQASISAASSFSAVGAPTPAIKIFNFEKVTKRGRPLRRRLPENLIRRAGGLKKRKDLKYADFEPLYNLWCGYFGQLLDQVRVGGGGEEGRLDERVLKADFHGCLLQVASAANPSQVGLHGIVVYESQHTFHLITRRNDRLLVIPKEGATFRFAFRQRVYTLFGDALRRKAHARGRRPKGPHQGGIRIPFFLD